MDKTKVDEKKLKETLTPEEYAVLREGATEAPFSGKHLDTKTPGMFACKVCGNQLFDSNTKFDSGSGWPSFDKAIPNAIELKEDSSYNMQRTEVVCAQCGSHLGHLFNDGPTESGERYCINSVCLTHEEQN